MSLRAKTLADLQALRRRLGERQREADERTHAEHVRGAEDRRERELFAHAVGPVNRLHAPARAVSRAAPPAVPLQRERDEEAALRATLSDAVDGESLLETDERLSFRRPDIGPDVLRKLRRGEWSIQSELDLHGLTRDGARDRLSAFLRQARQQGWRCLRVVHGKGNGSPGGVAVLKAHVGRWLARSDCVIAFVQARGADGGAGALLVLLRPERAADRGTG